MCKNAQPCDKQWWSWQCRVSAPLLCFKQIRARREAHATSKAAAAKPDDDAAEQAAAIAQAQANFYRKTGIKPPDAPTAVVAPAPFDEALASVAPPEATQPAAAAAAPEAAPEAGGEAAAETAAAEAADDKAAEA